MLVRKFESRDVKCCLGIYNYYIKYSIFTFEERELSVKEFEERMCAIGENFPVFVAEEGGEVVGYGYLDVFNGRSAYRYTADLSVYVEHDCLKAGAGSALLNELEKAARSMGLRNIISIITSENVNSIRFHEKHGFYRMGEFKNVGYKFERWLSVAYYQKEL